MSEFQNEILQAKGNIEMITIFVSKKFKEGESDVAGVEWLDLNKDGTEHS